MNAPLSLLLDHGLRTCELYFLSSFSIKTENEEEKKETENPIADFFSCVWEDGKFWANRAYAERAPRLEPHLGGAFHHNFLPAVRDVMIEGNRGKINAFWVDEYSSVPTGDAISIAYVIDKWATHEIESFRVSSYCPCHIWPYTGDFRGATMEFYFAFHLGKYGARSHACKIYVYDYIDRLIAVRDIDLIRQCLDMPHSRYWYMVIEDNEAKGQHLSYDSYKTFINHYDWWTVHGDFDALIAMFPIKSKTKRENFAIAVFNSLDWKKANIIPRLDILNKIFSHEVIDPLLASTIPRLEIDCNSNDNQYPEKKKIKK
jgi:hypothetical protein